jgi:hypothetical protein
MPFVACLKGLPDLLLLAEDGIVPGVNVAFGADGHTGRFAHVRFDSDSEREVDLGIDELTEAQRSAYDSYWRAMRDQEDLRRRKEQLDVWANRHPFRQGDDRIGGAFVSKRFYEWPDAVARLERWLKEAIDEDVIGEIGSWGGKEWMQTIVPGIDGRPMSIGIHADTRARGVADFLWFVERCGGPVRVRAKGMMDGPPRLTSEDGKRQFPGNSEYSYFYL